VEAVLFRLSGGAFSLKKVLPCFQRDHSNQRSNPRERSGRRKGENMQLEFIADLRDRRTYRSLKIEADGDGWAGKIKPKIRLKGKWLERAGFRPGSRVKVTSVTAGVMELRSVDAAFAESRQGFTP
jgi:hypothetical protein